MSLDLDTILSGVLCDQHKPEPLTQVDVQRAKRSASTAGCRERKTAAHKQVLDAVGGDREALKTISVWVPRKRTERMFFRAFDRQSLAEGGAAFHDAEYETESTDYTLEQIEVERAKPPKEEVEYAKLQGRFVQQTASINGFFAPKETVHTARRPTDYYAPLGDFQWADRDENTRRVNDCTHAARKQAAAKPIRTVADSK